MASTFEPSSKTTTTIHATPSNTPSDSFFQKSEITWWQRNFGFSFGKQTTKKTHVKVLPTIGNSIVEDVAFHPQPKKTAVISIASGPRVSTYGNDKKKEKAERQITFPQPMHSVSYRQGDGKMLVAGGGRGTLRVLDIEKKAVLRSFHCGELDIRCVRFLRDGRHVLSAGDDALVRISELSLSDTNAPLKILKGHADSIRDCLVMKDEDRNLIVTGSYDHTVRVWDLDEEEPICVMDHGAPVEALAQIAQSLKVASVGGTDIKIWDVKTGKLIQRSPNPRHAKTITSVAYAQIHDDKARLITGGIDGFLRFHHPETLQCLAGFTTPSPISALGLSPNGSVFVIGSSDGTVTFRYRAKPPKKESKKRTAMPGTYSHFIRGQDIPPSPQDQFAGDKRQKTKKEKAWDTALRKFQYYEALDEAMTTNNPLIVCQVVEELARRQCLRIALSNRNEETILPILSFCTKHVNNPEYAGVVVDVADVLVDIYEPVIGQSEKILGMFLKLRGKVQGELGCLYDVSRMLGMMDAIVYTSKE